MPIKKQITGNKPITFWLPDNPSNLSAIEYARFIFDNTVGDYYGETEITIRAAGQSVSAVVDVDPFDLVFVDGQSLRASMAGKSPDEMMQGLVAAMMDGRQHIEMCSLDSKGNLDGPVPINATLPPSMERPHPGLLKRIGIWLGFVDKGVLPQQELVAERDKADTSERQIKRLRNILDDASKKTMSLTHQALISKQEPKKIGLESLEKNYEKSETVKTPTVKQKDAPVTDRRIQK